MHAKIQAIKAYSSFTAAHGYDMIMLSRNRELCDIAFLKGADMTIFIRVKAVGKRRDVLEKQHFSVPDGLDCAEKLIEHLVRENVRAYNDKEVDAVLLRCLSSKEIEDGAGIGKIGFGDRKNESDQDEEEAVANALQCFADSLYRVMINSSEALPGGKFRLSEGDEVTFIRLAMLAGRGF
jgi:hypothetical protein